MDKRAELRSTLRIEDVPTVRSRVAQKLREAIMSGTLKPGQRLIERELCEMDRRQPAVHSRGASAAGSRRPGQHGPPIAVLSSAPSVLRKPSSSTRHVPCSKALPDVNAHVCATLKSYAGSEMLSQG